MVAGASSLGYHQVMLAGNGATSAKESPVRKSRWRARCQHWCLCKGKVVAENLQVQVLPPAPPGHIVSVGSTRTPEGEVEPDYAGVAER